MLIELARKKTRVFSPCRISNVTPLSVGDDVIEPGNVIVTTRHERDSPLLSTEPCGYRDFCGCRAMRTDPPCLIVSKVINFLVYTSFPSSFSFSRQRHLTDSIRTRRTRCPSKGFTVDRRHTAIYRNLLDYLLRPSTTLCDTLCNRECKYRHASLGNAPSFTSS